MELRKSHIASPISSLSLQKTPQPTLQILSQMNGLKERERLTNWRKVYWRPLSTQTHQWKVGYKVSQLTANINVLYV